ncbi:MAG: DUF4430 domain-containing protein [Anaerovoracaceae bacterium]
MNYFKKRFITILLLIALIVTMVPVSAFGYEEEDSPFTVTDQDGTTYTVQAVSAVTGYSYGGFGDSMVGDWLSGIYKVVVDENVTSLTIHAGDVTNLDNVDYDLESTIEDGTVTIASETLEKEKSTFSEISFIGTLADEIDTNRDCAYFELHNGYTSPIYGLIIQFGDENAEDNSPFTVTDQDGTTYTVQAVSAVTGYSYGGFGDSMVGDWLSGIYKVVVDENVTSLTIHAGDVTNLDNVDYDLESTIEDGTVTIASETLEKEKSTFSEISFIGTLADEIDTNRDCAYFELHNGYTSPIYGLIIQFGGEIADSTEDLNLEVTEISLQDEEKPLRVGEENTVIVSVKNNESEKEASGFEMQLLSDGNNNESLQVNESIPAGKTKAFPVTFTPGNSRKGIITLTARVNKNEKPGISKEFVYGKYKITLTCRPEEGTDDQGEMKIQSISVSGNCYDENGNLLENWEPDPETYLVKNAEYPTYELWSDYGSRWDVTFTQPDGNCFAKLEYENGESVEETIEKLNSIGTLQLVFDKERHGTAYYEEIQLSNANISVAYNLSSQKVKVKGTGEEEDEYQLVEGLSYYLGVRFSLPENANSLTRTISFYEDERLIGQTTNWGTSAFEVGEYFPKAGAETLVFEVKQGTKVIYREIMHIDVSPAENGRLQFMETPLELSGAQGLAGRNIRAVYTLTDSNGTRYFANCYNDLLEYAGNGYWEYLATGTKGIIRDITGGYAADRSIDLTTIYAVGSEGEIYHFDGKNWAKEKSSNLNKVGMNEVAFLPDGRMIGRATSGIAKIYLSDKAYNAEGDSVSWTEVNSGNSTAPTSMVKGEDGKIYFAFKDGEIKCFDSSADTWTSLRHCEDEATYDRSALILSADAENDIWAAARTGASETKLLHYDGSGWTAYGTPLECVELPTGVYLKDGNLYCIYLSNLWKSTDDGASWTLQALENSSGIKGNLVSIQKCGSDAFYLGNLGAFYYDGTALGETAVSENVYNAKTVFVSISSGGNVICDDGTKKNVAWSGKVTVDNQFDITEYLTYYRYAGAESGVIPATAKKVWGPYNAEEGTGFQYPTVLHALIKMMKEQGADFSETTEYTYNGKTYTVPAVLDAQANLSGGVYVAMAGGLREFDAGTMSGWMYTVNGSYPNVGMSQWSLSDGDVISIHYVTKMTGGTDSPGSPTILTADGYDDGTEEIEIDPGQELTFTVKTIGESSSHTADMAFLYVDGRRYYNYTASGVKETAMTEEDGKLSITFPEEGVYEIYAYKQGVYAQSNIITVRVGEGNAKKEITLQADQSRYTPDSNITLTVKDSDGNAVSGAVIYDAATDEPITREDQQIATGEDGKAVFAAGEIGTYSYYAMGEMTKASIAVTLKVAEELGDISTAMADALELTNSYVQLISEKSPWNMIALDRQSIYSGTLNDLAAEIGESIEAKSGTQYELVTDYAKWVLAVQAAGGDPASLMYNETKINLLEKIYNFNVRLNDGTTKDLYEQGLNAPIWALIALDAVPEEVPQNALYSKADLVSYIVKAQKADGSFVLSSEFSDGDVDITAMALQALAAHKGESGVDNAIEKAVNWLAAQQQEDGGFASMGTVNSESTSQVIIALTALGMDPAAAPFKTEAGSTMLDALLYYSVGDGSFAHTETSIGTLKSDAMATEQAHLALAAYDKWKKSEASLYDMKAVERKDVYAPVISTDLRTFTTDEDLIFYATASDAVDGPVPVKVEYRPELMENWNVYPDQGQDGYRLSISSDQEKIYIRLTAEDAAGNVAQELYIVTYSKNTIAKSITLPASTTLEVGQNATLTAEVLPENTYNKTVKWTSSDPSVASVDANGKVTALKSGTVTITAETCDGSNLSASAKIICKLPESQTGDENYIRVTFRLDGDTAHGDTEPHHTLKYGGLTTWIPTTTVTIEKGATVGDVFAQVLDEKGFTYVGLSKNYISSITHPDGTYLAEFTNGNLSGWMYTVNGTHPEVGLNSYYLSNGDVIVWHYTDDYTKEEGSEKWNTDVNEEVTEVITTGTSGSATTTTPTEVAVSGSTATATVKSENAAEAIKQAQENKSAEIVLQVAASDTKGAETVKLQLDTATVKSIANDTEASLTIKTENGQVNLDREALTTIASEAKETTLTLEVVKVENPTETQQKAAGTNGQVLQLVVKSGDKIISDFNKGKATVTVEIPANLQDKKVAAIYIAEDGQIEQMSGKTVKIDGKDYYIFETPHFSAFALVDADELGLEVTDEEQAKLEKLISGVENTTLKATSKKVSNGIKIIWTKSKGYKVDYYEVFRSTKRHSGFGKAAFFSTKNTSDPAKTWYINTKSLKTGTRYYYKVRGVRILDGKKYYTQWSTKAWRIA